MTTSAAIRFLRRNSFGTIPRSRAAVVAKVLGRTLSDLGPAFRSSGRIPVPEFACALAGIKEEIPRHLMELISVWNTECATIRLAHRIAFAKNTATETDSVSRTSAVADSGGARLHAAWWLFHSGNGRRGRLPNTRDEPRDRTNTNDRQQARAAMMQ
jgi:hypothetical protein